MRQEAGGRRQKERGRRKEEEGRSQKKEGARRSIFTKMRCSLALSVPIAILYIEINDEEWAVMFSRQSGYFSTVNRIYKGR
ncbi:hypothetical protein QUA00_20550 [Microcoleus sp. T2B6]